MTLPVKARPAYGWNGDGKSAAEIESDIRQTKYRLDADVRELKDRLAPKRLLPVAAALGVALLTFLIRRVRARRR